MPNLAAVADAFEPAQWGCELHLQGGRLRLALRLGDDGGCAEPLTLSDQHVEAGLRTLEVLKEFSNEPLARAFAQYQAAFGELPNAEAAEGISFVREPAGAKPNGVSFRTIYCDLRQWAPTDTKNKSGA